MLKSLIRFHVKHAHVIKNKDASTFGHVVTTQAQCWLTDSEFKAEMLVFFGPKGNSTVAYTTIFAQRSGVSRTLWVPLEPMLNWHFSSRYLAVLCSTDQHDFTFIREIRCYTNA